MKALKLSTRNKAEKTARIARAKAREEKFGDGTVAARLVENPALFSDLFALNRAKAESVARKLYASGFARNLEMMSDSRRISPPVRAFLLGLLNGL